VLWFFIGAGLAEAAVTAPASPMPQPESSVPHMLELTWSAGRRMPQGMQDNCVAILVLVPVAEKPPGCNRRQSPQWGTRRQQLLLLVAFVLDDSLR
jgi:hypothetical protein